MSLEIIFDNRVTTSLSDLVAVVKVAQSFRVILLHFAENLSIVIGLVNIGCIAAYLIFSR